MSRKLRLAGAQWRLLVHTYLGGKGIKYGDSHHVASDRTLGGGDGLDSSVEHNGKTYWSRHTEIPGTEFDELVVGKWCHIEQMDTGRWWMNIGGVTIWLDADRDGRPKHVSVFGPDDYAERSRGCVYRLTWSGDDPAEGEKPLADPLAICEWCFEPTADPFAPCGRDDCRAKTSQLDAAIAVAVAEELDS